MSFQPHPDGYGELLATVKADVLATRLRAGRAVDNEMLGLYWRVGSSSWAATGLEGWGSKVLGRLSADLRGELPDQRGWGPSNLSSMRAFAAAWPDPAILQSAIGKLQWGHVVTLLNRVDDADDRTWYAGKAVDNGWSGKVLEQHVSTGLWRRMGPPQATSRRPWPGRTRIWPRSWSATRLRLPDPGSAGDRAGRRGGHDGPGAGGLLELGGGFAFVGRQVRLMWTGTSSSLICCCFMWCNCGTSWWN